MNNFNVFGKKGKQDVLKKNEISLISKEIELMNKEYPKHPDFVRRIQSILEDNHRLRILLENQNRISEEKYSNIILTQFLTFYDQFIKIRNELFDQKQNLNEIIKEKENEVKEIKERAEREINRLNERFNENLEKTKKLKLDSLKEKSSKNSKQVLRILETFKAAIDDSNTQIITF